MRAPHAGLALLAVVALAGCGSVPDSVIDLRRAAGTICQHTNHTFKGVAQPTSQAQDAAFLRSGATRLEPQLRQLRRLTPPHDVADVYGAALGALSQELTLLRTAVTAIDQGEDPVVAYRTLKAQITPLESQANGAWQALQLADCLQ